MIFLFGLPDEGVSLSGVVVLGGVELVLRSGEEWYGWGALGEVDWLGELGRYWGRMMESVHRSGAWVGGGEYVPMYGEPMFRLECEVVGRWLRVRWSGYGGYVERYEAFVLQEGGKGRLVVDTVFEELRGRQAREWGLRVRSMVSEHQFGGKR